MRFALLLFLLLTIGIANGSKAQSPVVTDIPPSTLAFGPGLNGPVKTLLYNNDTWFVGGNFTTADGILVNHIARWTNNEWRSLQSGLNGPVHTLGLLNNFLYVGGNFTEVGSQTVNHIVRWDGVAWQALGAGVNGTVNAIQVHKGSLYIAGEFTTSGGTTLNHVARWTGTQWVPLGTGMNAPVLALQSIGDDLVAGGVFTSAGGAPANRIARWNGISWGAIGAGFSGSVNAITQHQGEIIAAGTFSGAVSTWNGTTWTNMGQNLNGAVYSVTSDGDDLVIGGEFTSSEDATIKNVANFKNGVWRNPGSSDNKVQVVVVRNEVIHIGGSFSRLAGFENNYFGRLALDLPNKPRALFPVNNSSEVTTSPIFEWSPVDNAFSFQVQVSLNSSFDTLEQDILTTESNKTQLHLDNGLTTYYYRIRSINNLGVSNWSDITMFRTRLASPRALSPTSQQTGLGSNVVFSWSTVPQAQSYWLQLSNANNFENTLIADERGLPTTFTFTGLSDNNTYYWRLKAEKAGERAGDFSQSDWSPIREFTVNLPPTTPLPITPEDGQLNSDTLNVKFKWGPVLNANDFQIQISRSESFQETDFDELATTTEILIPRLQSQTTYYWRVRARNIGGQSAWSAIRSLVTIMAPPSQVNLVEPINNSNNQNRVSLSPYLKWNKALRSDKYRIQVSNSPSFTSFVLNAETSDTTFQARDLIPNRTYYWRVRSSNTGGEGIWSTVFVFTTVNDTPTTSPILSLPGNDAIDLDPLIQLMWQSTVGASSYRVQLSLTADFAKRLVDTTGVQSTFYILPRLLTSERYYWRISALNQAGESAWSETRTFRTVVVIPAIPELRAPSDNLFNAKPPVLLDWSNVQGATSYSMQVSTDNTFETIVFSSDGQAATAFLLTSLQPQTTYYWRVRARNLAGFGDWSVIRSFTTVVQIPDEITLITPLNQTINTPIPALLRWSPSPRSEGYRVQLSNIPDLNSAVLADINVTNTFFSVTNLNKGQTYYWRVAAFNSGGQGVWSQVRSFTTIPEPPLAPSLISPSNTLDYISQPILMQWASSSFVEKYQLQLSLSIDFESQLVIDDPNITDTKLDLTGTAPLPFNTILYWRVKSFNSSGESAWSEVRLFRTLPELPAQTRIINPANGDQLVFMPLALQWEAAPRAQGYDIQISENKRFDTELVVDAKNYNDVTLILNNLKPEQSYWARVASRNVSGLSAWSDTTQFKTAPKVPDPPVLLSPTAGSSNAKRSQTFVWRTNPKAQRYQFQISTLPDFSTVLLTTEERSDTSITRFLDSFNQDYFWRVRAINVSGPGLWSNTNQLKTFSYSGTLTVQKSIPFANLRQSSYRLAAIGGDAETSIIDTFRGYGKQGTDWNAFAEIGSNANGLSNTVEAVRNSSGFNLRPGRGFWILANRDWVFNRTSPSVALTNQDSYRILLNPGWNIIGNPFERSVSWSAVQQLNSITDPIFAFEGLWVQSTTLQVNTGYYFFNRGNKTELEIPYQVQTQTSATGEAEPDGLATQKRQIIALELFQGKALLGTTYLSLLEEASIGFDDHDHVAPPRTFSIAGILLYKNDIHHQITHWSSLSYPSRTNLIAEKVVVEVSESGEYALHIDNLLEGMDSYLFEPKSGRTLRFDSNGEVELYLLKGSHTFEWIVGNSNSIEQHGATQLPQEFRLFDSYPNPFNPTTNISFALPTDSSVQIQIFDVTGRRVALVIDRELNAGYHQVVWDASRLASGVYIVEMRAGTFRVTGKVALVK